MPGSDISRRCADPLAMMPIVWGNIQTRPSKHQWKQDVPPPRRFSSGRCLRAGSRPGPVKKWRLPGSKGFGVGFCCGRRANRSESAANPHLVISLEKYYNVLKFI